MTWGGRWCVALAAWAGADVCERRHRGKRLVEARVRDAARRVRPGRSSQGRVRSGPSKRVPPNADTTERLVSPRAPSRLHEHACRHDGGPAVARSAVKSAFRTEPRCTRGEPRRAGQTRPREPRGRPHTSRPPHLHRRRTTRGRTLPNAPAPPRQTLAVVMSIRVRYTPLRSTRAGPRVPAPPAPRERSRYRTRFAS